MGCDGSSSLAIARGSKYSMLDLHGNLNKKRAYPPTVAQRTKTSSTFEQGVAIGLLVKVIPWGSTKFPSASCAPCGDALGHSTGIQVRLVALLKLVSDSHRAGRSSSVEPRTGLLSLPSSLGTCWNRGLRQVGQSVIRHLSRSIPYGIVTARDALTVTMVLLEEIWWVASRRGTNVIRKLVRCRQVDRLRNGRTRSLTTPSGLRGRYA